MRRCRERAAFRPSFRVVDAKSIAFGHSIKTTRWLDEEQLCVEALQGSWHGRHAGENEDVQWQHTFFDCLLHVRRGLFRHLCNILELCLQVAEIENRFQRSEVTELRNISVSTIDSFQVSTWWGAIILKLCHTVCSLYGDKPALHANTSLFHVTG